MRACAAILVLLAGCTSPEPQTVIPAMAPAPPPQCEVEWPADHAAAPVLACNDGSRQAIRPGTGLVVGDRGLAEALP